MQQPVGRAVLVSVLLLLLPVPLVAAAEASHTKALSQYKRLAKSHVSDERLQAVSALAGVEDSKAAKYLIKHILEDKVLAVAEKAAKVLGTLRSDEVAKEVCKAGKKLKAEDAREILLLEALGRIQNPKILPTLLKLAKQKDRKLQILGMEGLGYLRASEAKAVAACKKAIQQDKDFGVRITATEALAQTPHKDAIPLLIEAAKVPGRVQETALRGLMLLTGKALGENPDAWAAWWKKEGKAFALDVEAARGRKLADMRLGKPLDAYHFYDIEIRAKRVLFVIDKSGSMNWGEPPRMEGVKAELLRLLGEIDKTVSFNMVFFSHKIAWWKGMKIHPADEKNQTNARGFIRAVQPGGATRTDEVMARAFRFCVVKEQVETVCLLTDGAPFFKAYLDMDEVAAKIRAANRFHKARIHTIGCFTGTAEARKTVIGEPPRAQLVAFLQRIAAENDGRFKEVKGPAKGK